jgi:hypothetical protein
MVDHHRDAEVLVALAELVDGGALVGVVHEVDVALEDLGSNSRVFLITSGTSAFSSS